MALKDIWIDRVDGVEEASAEDINNWDLQIPSLQYYFKVFSSIMYYATQLQAGVL